MVISVGGAYVRIWRSGRGLTAEVPSAAVVEKDGTVVVLGESAASREGKLSEPSCFVRPFLADHIVHRELLRDLLRSALEKSQSEGSLWERWRATLLVPPTMPPLHVAWLEKTIREAGIGWVERRDPLASLVRRQSKRVKGTAVMGVVDWGFSLWRAAIYSGDEILAVATAPNLSVVELCRQVAAAERAASHRLFPLTDLYSLEWGINRVAYDERAARPAAGMLSAQVVAESRQIFSAEAVKIMSELTRSLSSEQAAFFRQHGWLVVGGGAELIGSNNEEWEKILGVPVRIAANATYATLQGLEK